MLVGVMKHHQDSSHALKDMLEDNSSNPLDLTQFHKQLLTAKELSVTYNHAKRTTELFEDMKDKLMAKEGLFLDMKQRETARLKLVAKVQELQKQKKDLQHYIEKEGHEYEICNHLLNWTELDVANPWEKIKELIECKVQALKWYEIT